MNTSLKINPGTIPLQKDLDSHINYISEYAYLIATYGEQEAKKRWQKRHGDAPLPEREKQSA